MNKYGWSLFALLLLALASLVVGSYFRHKGNTEHYHKACEKSGGVPAYNGQFMVCLPAPPPETKSTSSLPQPTV